MCSFSSSVPRVLLFAFVTLGSRAGIHTVSLQSVCSQSALFTPSEEVLGLFLPHTTIIVALTPLAAGLKTVSACVRARAYACVRWRECYSRSVLSFSPHSLVRSKYADIVVYL